MFSSPTGAFLISINWDWISKYQKLSVFVPYRGFPNLNSGEFYYSDTGYVLFSSPTGAFLISISEDGYSEQSDSFSSPTGAFLISILWKNPYYDFSFWFSSPTGAYLISMQDRII